jgi:hypothetical protein
MSDCFTLLLLAYTTEVFCCLFITYTAFALFTIKVDTNYVEIHPYTCFLFVLAYFRFIINCYFLIGLLSPIIFVPSLTNKLHKFQNIHCVCTVGKQSVDRGTLPCMFVIM